MSINTPPDDWFQAPQGGERLWIGLALCWCITMFVMMPYWHFKGKQNSTGESYRVLPAEYVASVFKFAEAHKVGTVKSNFGADVPIVEPPPGTDAYLVGNAWQWYPVLKLRKGQQYRLHISSGDYQHGFSLQPMNMNFMALPGYDHVLTITPQDAGTFSIICNEFCGAGHHMMTGQILVE